MARSLGIPAVVGTGGIVAQVKSGQVVALDGTSGEVVLHPEAAELAEWQQRQNQLRTDRRRRQALAAQPAITVDASG